MNIEIKRDYYLGQLLTRRNNGLIKVITGLRRCGNPTCCGRCLKSSVERGITQDHIIEMAFDLLIIWNIGTRKCSTRG